MDKLTSVDMDEMANSSNCDTDMWMESGLPTVPAPSYHPSHVDHNNHLMFQGDTITTQDEIEVTLGKDPEIAKLKKIIESMKLAKTETARGIAIEKARIQKVAELNKELDQVKRDCDSGLYPATSAKATENAAKRHQPSRPNETTSTSTTTCTCGGELITKMDVLHKEFKKKNFQNIQSIIDRINGPRNNNNMGPNQSRGNRRNMGPNTNGYNRPNNTSSNGFFIRKRNSSDDE